MRIKRPAEYSMGIDIDAAVIQKFCQENPTACSTYVRDAIKWLYPPHIYLCDDPSTLVYLDPPYLMSTRSAGRAIYRHEFAIEEEHRDFRERERIKRKQARWRSRLEGMPDTERYAMLSVIEGLRTTGNNPPPDPLLPDNRRVVLFIEHIERNIRVLRYMILPIAYYV